MIAFTLNPESITFRPVVWDVEIHTGLTVVSWSKLVLKFSMTDSTSLHSDLSYDLLSLLPTV